MKPFSIVIQTIHNLSNISLLFSGYPCWTLCMGLLINGYSYREEVVKITPWNVH